MIFNPVYGGASAPNLQSKTNLSITANGSFSYTPDAGYDGLSEVSGTVNVSGGGAPFRYDLGSFFGDTAGAATTSRNATIEAGRTGQKVWLIIMHRAAVTVSGSMTLVDSTKEENYNQWISIYEKTITSASAETITITQASSVRMCACTFYVPTGFTLGTPTQQPMDSGASTYQYSVASANSNRLIVMNNRYSAGATLTTQPVQNTLPGYSVTSGSNTIRLLAFVASNVNTIVISQQITAATDDRNNNRLFIYEISAA